MIRRRKPSYLLRGFTLVELIVSIVVIGILAAMVTPRLLVTDDRRASQEARDVAGMLEILAQRSGYGSHHLALSYEQSTGVFRMEALRTRGDRSGFRERASREWARDLLAPELDLSVIRIEEARFDGRESESAREWRVEFAPGVPRPHIELVLSIGDSRSARWVVELLPYATEPRLLDAGSAAARESVLRAVDLDAMGMSEVDW